MENNQLLEEEDIYYEKLKFYGLGILNYNNKKEARVETFREAAIGKYKDYNFQRAFNEVFMARISNFELFKEKFGIPKEHMDIPNVFSVLFQIEMDDKKEFRIAEKMESDMLYAMVTGFVEMRGEDPFFTENKKIAMIIKFHPEKKQGCLMEHLRNELEFIQNFPFDKERIQTIYEDLEQAFLQQKLHVAEMITKEAE